MSSERKFLDFMVVLANENEYAAEHVLSCAECKSVLKKIISIKIRDKTQTVGNNGQIDTGIYLVKTHMVAAGIMPKETRESFGEFTRDPMQ